MQKIFHEAIILDVKNNARIVFNQMGIGAHIRRQIGMHAHIQPTQVC